MLKSGSDKDGCGTLEQPCRTLLYVLQEVQPSAGIRIITDQSLTINQQAAVSTSFVYPNVHTNYYTRCFSKLIVNERGNEVGERGRGRWGRRATSCTCIEVCVYMKMFRMFVVLYLGIGFVSIVLVILVSSSFFWDVI